MQVNISKFDTKYNKNHTAFNSSETMTLTALLRESSEKSTVHEMHSNSVHGHLRSTIHVHLQK